MTAAEYRIERPQSAQGGLIPAHSLRETYTSRSLAVAVAVKSLQDPTREQVRVVHVATGEVVFETAQPPTMRPCA